MKVKNNSYLKLTIISWFCLVFWFYIFYLGSRPNHELPAPLTLPFLLLPLVSGVTSVLSYKQKHTIFSISALTISCLIILFLLCLILNIDERF